MRAHPQAASKLFHIPNGGHRNPVTASLLKNIGVRAGVSDYFLAMPIALYAGLWIEVKSEKGSVSDLQRYWIESMRDEGYAAAVTYGYPDTIEVFDSYVRGDLDAIACQLETITRTDRKLWAKKKRTEKAKMSSFVL